ncbi:unnamed protein product [Symbiodinium natans]|uniref:Uncharacterized protein n=1 Tax=Symbiodinium natans TaxID=878477 RepID=A0A812NSG9_9DINO|nr:unnamed protein product [Symbiodinium natans]
MEDERLWNSLLGEGIEAHSELRATFLTPWHLAVSVLDEADAITVFRQLVSGEPEIFYEQQGRLLWRWIGRNQDLLQRVQARLLSKCRRVEAYMAPPVSAAEVYDAVSSHHVVLKKVVRRSQRRWLTAGSGTLAEIEQKSKQFWGNILLGYMVEAQLPFSQLPVADESQRREIALRAFGARRSKTLRNRARCWRKARDWFLSFKGTAFPTSNLDVVGYMIFLEQEVGAKSCINDFLAALSVLEDAGQVSVSNQLCKDRLVLAASKSYVASAPSGQKQAPPLTVAMLISLELYVCDRRNPMYARCLAWACLLCVWACMRISDLQGIDMSRLKLFSAGLRGSLVRTKTTGSDKKVAEVPFFVRRDANLSGSDWLRIGRQLWVDLGHLNRDFLVWQTGAAMDEPRLRYAAPEVIAGYMRNVWAHLRVPEKKFGRQRWELKEDAWLLAGDCYMFWSGHSMRHFLPTVSAIFGEPKDRRDYLGRWHVGLHQSADYLHTCRQIVLDVQKLVCDKLCGGKPGYDEDELFAELRQWLVVRGCDPDPVVKSHMIMRLVDGARVLNQRWPMIGGFGEAEADVSLPEGQEEGAQGQASPFWVSVSRKSGQETSHSQSVLGVALELPSGGGRLEGHREFRRQLLSTMLPRSDRNQLQLR